MRRLFPASAAAQSAACQDMQFSQSVLERFPGIRDAYRDVIAPDEQRFAVRDIRPDARHTTLTSRGFAKFGRQLRSEVDR